ncbi:DUF6615 family protein [Nodularia sp. NIES-3585]|uniref:DUF6615 family protein n=1 Tax=Nodularia sp. NIES-3585 TaxID=1973477 RepID=UPI000B632059|nr:DUF6615 family protein [Nodularia sp. NIES-3585]GAX39035.1 hypothetical protein NIES3585_50870 [Nodularia sp. NIES-3585]
MKAVDIFESLASLTWERIKLGQIHKVSQSEETITDLNLLEIARINCPEVQVVKTPKDKEKYQGTDWEWWIGNNRIGWLRYAVQAKKINPKNTRYDALAHKVDDILQIDILEQFARVNRAIPLYCFYNYLENIALEKYWRCNLFYEAEQFGCTITPSSNVRTALSKRGARKFNFLHSVAQTRPWRCLVRCPLMHQVYLTESTNHTSLGFENVTVYQRLPSELSAALETGSLNQFSSEFYNQNLEMYPKRILVANYIEFE